MLLKSFLRGPSDPIETRLMVRRADDWVFASYRWSGADAVPLDDSRLPSDGIMRMPPLGVSRVDPLAAELLTAWIDGREDRSPE